MKRVRGILGSVGDSGDDDAVVLNRITRIEVGEDPTDGWRKVYVCHTVSATQVVDLDDHPAMDRLENRVVVARFPDPFEATSQVNPVHHAKSHELLMTEPLASRSQKPSQLPKFGVHASVAIATALLLSSCAVVPDAPDPRTPEQVIAQTSGRSMASSDTVSPGSGFGLDGLGYAVAPITQKCHQQQAQLLTGRKREVIFQDRRRQSRPITLSLTEIVICSKGSTPLWGANVDLVDTEYLVAQSIGTGINYYAKVRTTFVSGEAILANREAVERSRVASEASLKEHSEARLARLAECRRQREEYSKEIRTNPRPGTKVTNGLVVEVKLPLALIQYDRNGQALTGRQQEWVPVSTLRAADDCQLRLP